MNKSKPLIWQRSGIYYCALPHVRQRELKGGPRARHPGTGFTADEAFEDWKKAHDKFMRR